MFIKNEKIYLFKSALNTLVMFNRKTVYIFHFRTLFFKK